jgi:hypothetical protein
VHDHRVLSGCRCFRAYDASPTFSGSWAAERGQLTGRSDLIARADVLTLQGSERQARQLLGKALR